MSHFILEVEYGSTVKGLSNPNSVIIFRIVGYKVVYSTLVIENKGKTTLKQRL